MGGKRIERLTARQEARFGEFVERWTAVGLCTEPADRPRAEAAVAEAYRIGGLAAPRWVVWCGSPMGQALTRAILARGSVGASVGASVWASVWDSVWDSSYGQHDAGWLSFYSFFREVCLLVQETDRLAGISELAESAGWWLPHKHVCWISERHNVCRLDERRRLHAEAGPAIAYPDGWAIWAWHGVRVPQRVIEQPAKLTPQEILDEENVEVRRVMIDRFGADRLMRESNAELRDEVHEPPFPGLIDAKLWELPQPGDEPLVMVELVNSTREPDGEFKRVWLRVPPQSRTAHEAVAWTFDVGADEYAPVVET